MSLNEALIQKRCQDIEDSLDDLRRFSNAIKVLLNPQPGI
jgi:hypothetical protein